MIRPNNRKGTIIAIILGIAAAIAAYFVARKIGDTWKKNEQKGIRIRK